MPPLDLLASSAFGLEAVVSRELKGLGYEGRNIQPGRTLFTGTAEAIARSNLWLRTADRVLLRMGAFEARDFGVLFDATYALPWHEWIPADACFPVTGRSHKSQLSSVPACQKIVKKAIVEKLRAAHGVTELPETGPRFKVDVALLSDEATLTIDTSGAGLNKRGYRTLSGPAPLKETLAAALVLLSHWRAEQPLIDPFCGTGTIPIEAAMIGRNLAPGRLRTFDAEAWPAMASTHWSEARDEASAAALPALPQRVLGTDRDEEVLSLARYHAQQAGVAEDVHFQVKEFSDLTSKRQYGVVIANPPYGQRLGEQEEAAAVSRLMPQVLRRLPTWSHFILTATPDFESLVGQQATKRRKLYNARIECTYYQFYGPRAPRPGRSREAEPPVEAGVENALPMDEGKVTESEETVSEHFAEDVGDVVAPELSETTVAAHPLPAEDGEVRTARKSPATTRTISKPAFGGLPDRAANQAELFRNRLVKLARHLRRWPTRQGITCYRLYERDIPEVPLVVDRYENHLHIAEFARPNEHTLAEHAEWIDLMLKTAADALEVPRQNVYFKHRDRQRGNQQYE
ncbi:MAG: bifunctional 23S rRNA (guanine(2069)-N(7))-methyltransferase RlmK/23S rRNA (guanine(2445)-N(2))-methyltransferase RlmL, partial [Planctomycetia bacterium]|nr:bifunctional 23S rRNA (guanine(2069)-N(7))-methyltransferase RlmK/23S rRNA (guanine(2445)-N(2))-methyltransferase RlmL [Planctomycetia bacterium]